MLNSVLAFSILACTGLRTYQMFTGIEPVTGFNIGAEWLMILLYVLIFASCIAFCAISYLSKDTAELQPMGIKSGAVAVLAVVVAIRFLGEWIDNVFSGAAGLSGAEAASGFKGLMASGLLTGTLQGVFAFFSMVYMLIFAYDLKNGTVKASKFKILALAPAGWSCARLVEKFLSQISFLEVSDLFLELVMLSFMALFFMALAQVNSGVASTGISWRLSGLGYSASLIAVTLFVARAAVSIVKGSEYLNPSHLASSTDLMIAVFIMLLVKNMLYKNSVSEEV